MRTPESMRSAVQAPWQGAIVDFLERWWGRSDHRCPYLGFNGQPRPLACQVGHSESARRTIAHFGLTPGTQAGLAMPVQFIGGMMMVVRADVGGWNLTAAPIDPAVGYRPDFAALTPAQAQAWQQAYPDEWAAANSCSSEVVKPR